MTWRATSGAVLGGDVAGPVARAVVDDQHRGPDAADLVRDPVEDVADVLGLVVGGDDDGDPPPEPLRQRRLAELLPGEPLEHRGELARVAGGLRERSQDQDEEDEDREHGEAEDPAAVALFEREGREQRVGDFGAGDERQPEPGEEQDQDVGVAQRAAADDRVGDEDHGRARARRRGAPSALRGRRPPSDHGPLEDRAAPAQARVTPASGKTSVISTSLRREAARVAAPTRVTRTIGVAITTSSHQRRRAPSSDQAAEAEGDDQDLDTLPAVALIASPTPPLHIRQTLRTVIAAYPLGSSAK